jgi:predicted nucleotidyltransferase
MNSSESQSQPTNSDFAQIKIQEASSTFVTQLLEKYGTKLQAVIQFGSTARGHIKRHTDLDLFVVLDTDFVNLADKRAATFTAEESADSVLKSLTSSGYSIQVSAVVRTKNQALVFTPIYLDMTVHSVIHYEKDDFATLLIQRTKDKIAELGAVRKNRGLLWYWDLCPNFKPGDKAPI